MMMVYAVTAFCKGKIVDKSDAVHLFCRAVFCCSLNGGHFVLLTITYIFISLLMVENSELVQVRVSFGQYHVVNGL